MRRSALFCLVLFLLTLAACAPAPAPAPEPEDTTEADEGAIRAVVDQLVTAINAGDTESQVRLYVEDAIRMPPDQRTTSGLEAISSDIQAFNEEYEANLQIDVVEVQVTGDSAFARSIDSLQTRSKGGQEAIDVEGKGVFILQRGADGTWKISREIWNHDAPATGG